MARKPRWLYGGHDQGVVTYTLQSWKYFHDFILHHKLLDFKTYVYRGQQSEKWSLEPSLNRVLDKELSSDEYIVKVNEHLDNLSTLLEVERNTLNI